MGTPEFGRRNYSEEDKVDCLRMLQSVLEGDPPIDLLGPYEVLRQTAKQVQSISTDFDNDISSLLEKMQAAICHQHADLASELTTAIQDGVVSAQLLVDGQWLTVEAVTVADGRLVPVVKGERYLDDIEVTHVAVNS